MILLCSLLDLYFEREALKADYSLGGIIGNELRMLRLRASFRSEFKGLCHKAPLVFERLVAWRLRGFGRSVGSIGPEYGPRGAALRERMPLTLINH